MNQCYKTSTIGSLVTERLSRARLFETLNIDYCCGGNKLLEQACQEKGLDIESILQKLKEFDNLNTEAQDKDWDTSSLSELTIHIISTHHSYLRSTFPRLTKLIDKVARVYGPNNSNLIQLRKVFTHLCDELEMHLEKEERVLFPYCLEIDKTDIASPFHCGSVNYPIQVMKQEHETTADSLKEIRRLTNNLTIPEDACNTYQAMIDTLLEMERDIHLHIHKENNILFPKTIQKVQSLEEKTHCDGLGNCHHSRQASIE